MTMHPQTLEPRPVEAVRVPRFTSIESMTSWAGTLVQDMSFPTARAAAQAGQTPVGFFPVYAPQEIAHALGLFPVSLQGAGEALEITHADAPLGSFLCSISKSTLELALVGRLDPFGAFVFPYICDVARNLEGIFARRWPDKATHMLHLPQNFESASSLDFLTAEYARLVEKLERVAGRRLDPERLKASIGTFEEQRGWVRRLASLRQRDPNRLTLAEYYLLVRVGGLLDRDAHIRLLSRAYTLLRKRERRPRDGIRVLLVGPFCEQPTLELLQLLEETGCHVVGDELQMLPLWHGPMATTGEPLRDLAQAYLTANLDISVRRAPGLKAEHIRQRVRDAEAQGVVFLTAKFCEPAGEDLVLYRRALEQDGVPCLHMEFEERSTGYEQSRLALETFAESILFD